MSEMILKITARLRRQPNYRERNSHREYFRPSRIYVHAVGESIMDNLMNRRSRPYRMYREMLSDQPFMKDARWSQRAGCSCPCSPGFIADRRYTNEEGKPVDYHVSICDSEELAACEVIEQFAKAIGMLPSNEASYLDLVAA